MNRNYSVDRMDEEMAVLIAEDAKKIRVSRDMLAADVREGMVVSFRKDVGLYCCDADATVQRQQSVKAGVEALLKKGKK